MEYNYTDAFYQIQIASDNMSYSIDYVLFC